MSIDTTKKVVSIKVDGVSMPMDTGGIPNGVITGDSSNTFEVDNNSVTSVGNSAFRNNAGLRSVNLPEVLEVKDYAFAGTGWLTSINLPKATILGNSAFYSSGLINAEFPNVTTVGTQTFHGSGHASIPAGYLRLPKLNSVDGAVSFLFENSKFTTIYIGGTFQYQSNANQGNYLFRNSLVENLILPKTSGFESSHIYNCTNLQYVDISDREIEDGNFGTTDTFSTTFQRSANETNALVPYKINYEFYGVFKAKLTGYDPTQITLAGTPTKQNDTTMYNVTVPANGVVNPYIYNNGAPSMTIDWGDGNIDTITTNAGVGRTSHTYTNAGTYTITITSDYYYGNATNAWFNSASGGIMNTGTTGATYVNSITFGENYMDFLTAAFNGCSNLTSLTFKKNFYKFPSNNSLFNGCTSLQTIDFRNATKIPIAGAQSFSSLPSQTRIIVPDALYNDWITATNWVTIASQIVKVSEV